MLSRMDAISCGIFASTLTLPNHDGVFLFRAGECREAGAGSSPSHCEYSTSVMDRTVIPSCAVRVLILRYIVSGMSSVVLMGAIIPNPAPRCNMDLLIYAFPFHRAVYEKFKDGTVKDISEDIPFDIPASWKWVRLGTIAQKLTDGTHQTPKYCQSGVPFLSVKDISNGNVSFASCKFISEAEHKLLYSRCDPHNGDILLSKVGTTGIPVLVDTDVQFSLFVSVALLRIFNEYVYNKYILNAMLSPFSQMQVEDNTRGVGNKNWVMRDIAHTLIPLPPLAEQKRIVAKIEQLMPLVEEYGKMEETRLQLDADLSASLEKSILQEAIQGKLVPQDPNDEPASELLKRVAAERKALIKAGKLKRDKGESVIFRGSDRLACKNQGAPIDPPFEIPCGWAWCRLDEISLSVGNKNNQILAKEIRATGKWAVVSQGQNLIDGYSDFDEKAIEDLPIILFGDHTRNVKYLDFPFIVGADGTKIIKPLVDGKWLYYWMVYGASKIRNRGYARHWNEISKLPVPLPPLEEQKRIVARIEELHKVTQMLTM